MPDAAGNFKLSISVPELPWQKQPHPAELRRHLQADIQQGLEDDLERIAHEASKNEVEL